MISPFIHRTARLAVCLSLPVPIATRHDANPLIRGGHCLAFLTDTPLAAWAPVSARSPAKKIPSAYL